MFWSKQRHSSMRRCFKWSTSRILLYGRGVAGARSTPHSPRDFTATVRWNLVYCETKTPRCHQLGELEHCPVEKWKSLLIGIFHIGNFCFWVPFLNQLLLRNCAVDYVEICNVYIRKMIIKAAKRIFNSDKICYSYSDLNFGVTFLEHSVYKLL